MKRLISLLFSLFIIISIFTVNPVYAKENENNIFTFDKPPAPNNTIIYATNTKYFNGLELFVYTPKEILFYTDYFSKTQTVIPDNFACGYQIDYKINDNPWHYKPNWDKLDYSNMINEPFSNNIQLGTNGVIENFQHQTIFSTADNSEISGDLSKLVFKTQNYNIIDYYNNNLTFRLRTYITYVLEDGKPIYLFSDWTNNLFPQDCIDLNSKVSPISINTVSFLDTDNLISLYCSFNPENNFFKEFSYYNLNNKDNLQFEVEAILIPKNENGEFVVDKNVIKNKEKAILFGINESTSFSFDINSPTFDSENWAIATKIIFPNIKKESDYSKPIQLSTIAKNKPNYISTTPPQVIVKDTCDLCGFCPAPLGTCIFIYLIIFVAILIISIFILFYFKNRTPKY